MNMNTKSGEYIAGVVPKDLQAINCVLCLQYSFMNVWRLRYLPSVWSHAIIWHYCWYHIHGSKLITLYLMKLIMMHMQHQLKFRLCQGLYSLRGRTTYRRISWSLEAARFWFKLCQSLWNFTGTFGSRAVEIPVTCQNDMIIITASPGASRLHEILRFVVCE